jgi:hypothetical protein
MPLVGGRPDTTAPATHLDPVARQAVSFPTDPGQSRAFFARDWPGSGASTSPNRSRSGASAPTVADGGISRGISKGVDKG